MRELKLRVVKGLAKVTQPDSSKDKLNLGHFYVYCSFYYTTEMKTCHELCIAILGRMLQGTHQMGKQ